MNIQELPAAEALQVTGGDFSYDFARVLRFIYLSGGGIYTDSALTDWAAAGASNDVLKSNQQS